MNNIDRWISVENQLPESGKKVIAFYKNCNGLNRTIIAIYSKKHTIEDSTESDLETDYCEKTDRYYLPEGWYEYLENWADYTFIELEHEITHWMSLPDAPLKNGD